MDQMDCLTSAAAPASIFALPPSNYRGKIAWPSGPAKKQNFSLPDGIIYYIARNPKSPEIYLKLAFSCKYFFEMLPLLIAKRIIVAKAGSRICLNNAVECKKKNQKCCVKMNLATITRSKIWLIGYLRISFNENISSTLLPKLHCSKNASLRCNLKEMTMDEFKLWASVFQKIMIYKTKVIDSDGSIVTLDSLLEATHDVKGFRYWLDDGTPAAVTSTTMKNIIQLKNLVKLERFVLINIPEAFDVKDLSAFMKTYKDTKFYLAFQWNISAEYKVQLDSLVVDVIASGLPNRIIHYYGQDDEKFRYMEIRYQ